MTDPFRIYIGWDRRLPDAYEVARFSLARRTSIPIEITPIKLDAPHARGLYDPLTCTEFTWRRLRQKLTQRRR